MEDPLVQVYQPLSKSEDQFRLLHLQPATIKGNGSPDMICKLGAESLGHHPSYQALSYVWGDSSDPVDIIVNGLTIPVTRNLYSALKRLRLEDEVRVLWVDALCINQADLEEREQQVVQMRYIYQKAESVVAILGDSFDGIDAALQYLTLSAADPSRHIERGREPYLSVGDWDMNSKDLAVALIRLFYLPWWKRLWTVQEYILAREVVFYCGQRVIPAKTLFDGVYNVISHGIRCCDPDSGVFSKKFSISDSQSLSHNVWHGFNNFLSFRSWDHANVPEFHCTLARFRTRLSTNPRDKIYGLLGLAPKKLDGVLTLDYSASVESVYETFTVQYVQHQRNLGLLGNLVGERQLPNLASFCPDWTVQHGDDTSNDETMMVQLANRLEVQRAFYSASGKSEAVWQHVGPGTVAVNGLIFDEIETVSPECFRRPWKRRQEWAKSIRDMAKHVEAKSFLMALSGGLARSMDQDFYNRIPESEGEVDHRLAKWWEWTSSADSPSSARDKDIEHAVLTLSAGRSFAVTKRGYIGYVDQHCRPGHVVSILGGGYVPFILAPEGSDKSRYRVIGDAYIQGMMLGQAFELVGKQSGEFDEIVLI